jgi:hypothetical protein
MPLEISCTTRSKKTRQRDVMYVAHPDIEYIEYGIGPPVASISGHKARLSELIANGVLRNLYLITSSIIHFGGHNSLAKMPWGFVCIRSAHRHSRRNVCYPVQGTFSHLSFLHVFPPSKHHQTDIMCSSLLIFVTNLKCLIGHPASKKSQENSWREVRLLSPKPYHIA